MGFWDHFNELRGTIIKSLAVFALLAAPLIALYEIAIVVAKRVEGHRERSGGAALLALLALLSSMHARNRAWKLSSDGRIAGASA